MKKRLSLSVVLILTILGLSVVFFSEKSSQVRAMMSTYTDVCGDGNSGSGSEECDDGNLNNSDGCSSLCIVEDAISPVLSCSDNIDNDNDRLSDIKDPGCHTDWDANNVDTYNPASRSEYEIQRVSVSSDGSEGNSWSWSSYSSYDAPGYSISSDGRYAVFESSSDNLVQGDTNEFSDIFVRDRLMGETRRVNVASDGAQANDDSFYPAISADGRFIVFESTADNLVQGDTNSEPDIFMYDYLTVQTKRINVSPDGAEANGYSGFPSMSPDGKYVRFYSDANNLIPGQGAAGGYFTYDIQADNLRFTPVTTEEVLYDPMNYPSFSANGQYVVFGSYQDNLVAEDHNTKSDIFIRDTQTGTTNRISMVYDGFVTNGDSFAPSISSDGRYVVFSSLAGYLVEGDNNLKGGVFVYDRWTRRTVKVNLGIDGAEGKGGYFDVMNTPSISPNGKYIMFYSGAWNLVPSDHNGTDDAFVTINPLFVGDNSVPLVPSDLIQRNESDNNEVGVGTIVNEGAIESADSIILSAKVESPKGGRVALEVYIESVDEVSGVWTSFEPIRSEYVQSGEVATIDYTVSKGGLYTWRAKTVNEAGSKSDWAHFGDNGIGADFISSNFSFVFLTDVHLGSNYAPVAVKFSGPWYESQSYPRFTDVLYEIENLNPKPDFILIGGDNVEYNNERWLYDFKSITEGYSQRTGIKIYFVPGNHDRYDSESTAWSQDEMNFVGGNDYLHNFLSVMGNPKNATSFFAGTGIMDFKTSEAQGLNQYNYYFDYKGFQFIGLDSGEDTAEQRDTNPEGSGLNGNVLSGIKDLVEANLDIPSVIFMHHPVYTGTKDAPALWLTPDVTIPKEETKTDTGEIAEDGAIINSWKAFINLCSENNIQLVLSGHEHNDPIFDKDGFLVNLSNWTEAESEKYPLYIQTQSAGKGDNHGYRIINVKNGKAIPREVVTGVKKYEKVYTDLNAENALDFRVYDSDGNEITVENSNKATMFLAENSDRRIIYNDTEKSHFEVKNNNATSVLYDLHLQKREEWAEPAKQPASVHGYHIYNEELCSGDASYCNGFLALIDGGDYKIVYFKDIKIKENSSHVAFVDWDDVKVDWGGILSTKIEGISFGVNGDYNNLYSRDSTSITVDLNSPGELRVFDKNGKVTGVVDGEIVENIPNSIYIPESETVYIFGDTRGEVADGLKTQVVGAYEATYDLSISLSENDKETSKFTADDVLTNDQTTHQFSVNWEALERGEKGVTMQFDEGKDTVFERSIPIDGSLSFPKAKLSAEKYSANEGAEIVFDGSVSSDSDGSIVLYEWDFDGDGAYDADSVVPTISHIYGDDFVGEIFLRVTDNEGLKGVNSAQVTVTNANPTAMITKFEMADIIDKNIIGEKSTDLGWLSANSNSGVVDAMGKFILEGTFADSGWLDIHSATVDWGDGNIEDIQVTEENIYPEVNGNISASHKYTELKNYVVKLTVTDDDGGITTSEIALESPKQIKQVALLKLENIQTDNKNVRKEIERAIENLKESLKSKYWEDDFRLNLLSAPKFFSEEKKAIKSLEKIISDKKKYTDFQGTQEVQEIIDGLSQSDVFLAKIMVYDAGSLAAKNLKSAKSWVVEILNV